MVKTYRRLYHRIWDWDNLYLAYRRARKGKRGHEVVADFEFALEDNLVKLQDELAAKTYCPGPYHSFYIHEPKRRLISAAPFRDRVVHHALCQVIEPIWERRFIHDSYANRQGKGTHRALDRCTYFARCNRYVLQCDVRQYFPLSLSGRKCRAAILAGRPRLIKKSGAACPWLRPVFTGQPKIEDPCSS